MKRIGLLIMLISTLGATYGEQIVTGRGTGQGLSYAVGLAREDAANQCAAHQGVENVVIRSQQDLGMGYYEVEIEATCKEGR